MHWITSEWPWTLKWSKVPYIHYVPLRSKFWSVSLYYQLRYKTVENQKCTEWPQTDLHQKWPVYYTLSTSPRGSTLRPFHSWQLATFEIQACWICGLKFFSDRLIVLKGTRFCLQYLVFQDRWSFMAVVSQERLYCITVQYLTVLRLN